jgi:hypothetical protein
VLNGGDLFNALEQQQVGAEVALAVVRTTDGSSQQLEVKATLAAEK